MVLLLTMIIKFYCPQKIITIIQLFITIKSLKILTVGTSVLQCSDFNEIKISKDFLLEVNKHNSMNIL